MFVFRRAPHINPARDSAIALEGSHTLSGKAGQLQALSLEDQEYEVAFYTQVAAAIPEAPVPCCFDAVWNEDTNDWHLLLEDLTDSHFTLTYRPMPPTRPQSEAIVAARARFHAALWDDPRLGTSIGTWLEPHDPQIRRFAEEFARFADRVGDRLPAERRAVYER